MIQPYQLTDEEWRALGGTPPPEGYDTETAVIRRIEPPRKQQGGLQAHRTGLVPAVGNVLPIWMAVAKRLDIRMLSIRWPDAHYPRILAEKAGESDESVQH